MLHLNVAPPTVPKKNSGTVSLQARSLNGFWSGTRGSNSRLQPWQGYPIRKFPSNSAILQGFDLGAMYRNVPKKTKMLHLVLRQMLQASRQKERSK